MLALKIVREGYTYKEEVDKMDDEIIAKSEAVFSDKVVRGVIKAQSYNSHQWQMSDEVQQKVTLNFRLDEVHFVRKASKQLNCTLAQYQQAMRIVATSYLGFSLNYIQSAVTAMRNYANHLEFPTTYEAGQVIADLLYILPGDSTFRIQTIDKIHDIDNPKNEANQQRQLAHYQSYMEFDRYLEKFWAEATTLERIIFFPVYFWYKVTSIIPLRPTECVLTPRNCIRRDEAGAHLSLRRTKLKGTQQSCHYNIDDDYKKVEYCIPDDLAKAIEEYIMRTQDVYRSDIDVLFCKVSQFDGLNITHDNNEHYTYNNLNQCLSHFYSKILVSRFSLNIVSDVDLLLDGEIERILLGDTRHIALISLSTTTRDPIICQELSGHINKATQTHYSTNRRWFLDALGYMRAREARSRIPSVNTLITSEMLVNRGKGYCTNAAIRNGDYTKCAQAVDAYGMVGNCDVCECFLPNNHTAAVIHKANARKEHETICKLYCKALEQLRQGLGNHEALVSILDRLAATEEKYVRASAIEMMIKQDEDQSEKERKTL